MIHQYGWLIILLSFQLIVAQQLLPPLLDSERVGQLGIVGQFAGLSPYTNSAQTGNPSPGISIFEQDPTSIFSSLVIGNGKIYSSCILDQQLYLGGSFTTLSSNNNNNNNNNNLQLNNIARWDLNTNTLSALDQGLDGPVYSLYCDDTNHTVYVGGEFHQPIGMNSTSFAGSVAQWFNNQWLPLPWQGFNGPVHVITHNSKRNTLLFGGRFDATGDGVYFNTNTSQLVNLDQPTVISSGNGALSGNNSQPNSIICPNSTPQNITQPWLLQSDVPGYWQATFPYPIQPSMFRISNTQLPDQATRAFSILALGSNELFQLSFIDPTTRLPTTCSDMCFLANSPNITFQDFSVENSINTTGIRIQIHSWYGSGGGLGNVQIYQADNTLNPHLGGNNNCTGSNFPSTSVIGQWKETFAYGSYENFLTSTFPSSELSTTNTSLTYSPYIPSQGKYTIYANTPGCVGTSNCDQRTQVELTIQMTPNNIITMMIDQTNPQDISTMIYDGLIVPSTSTFQPTITLRPSPNATIPASSNVTLVAESLSFVRNGTNATLISILEFSPQNYSTQQSLAWHPLTDQLTPGSTVHTLDASNGDVLYIGGQFVGITSPYRNIAAYDYNLGKISTLNGNGLDGNVTSLLLSGTDLYVGGLFNNTIDQQLTGLNHVAVYHTTNQSWSTLAHGTDGNVEAMISSLDSSTITISGDFNHVIQPNGRSKISTNNAIWNPLQQKWTDRQAFIAGSINSWQPFATSTKNSSNMLVGNLQAAQTFYSVGATTFSSLTAPLWTQYYGLFDNDDTATVNSGLFWHNSTSNQQVTILGGQFTMQNGAIANIALYHDNTWSGFQLTNSDASPSMVNALLQIQGILYIGGQFSGQIQQQSVKSIAIYSLTDQSSVPVSGLTDDTGAPGKVNVMQPSIDGTKIYIGGNFAKAGSLGCTAVCEWDVNIRQWNPVGQGLAGEVQGLSVGNNKLTVIGPLLNQQQSTKIAQINPSSSSTWSTPVSSNTDLQKLTLTAVIDAPDDSVLVAGQTSDSQTVVGVVDSQQQFSVLSSSTQQQQTSSSSYLLPGGNIQQLLFVPTANSAADQSRYPPNTNSVLMAAGQLQLSKSGNATVALFDGTSWSPYVLSSQFNGQPGQAHAIFHELDCCKASNIRHYLPVPAVILISIAISLGLLFLLVGMGLGWMFLKRRRQGLDYPEPMPPWQPSSNSPPVAGYSDQDAGSSTQWRPSSSIAAILDAAQLATLGGAAGLAIASSSQQKNKGDEVNDLNVGDRQHGPGTATFDQLKALALLQAGNTGPATDERPQLYCAKYPFDAKEFGELGFDANESIVVTDTSDNVWWMGYKDDGTGKPISGLFPSNYVSRSST
ncbi:cortical protein marker for cell polarity-domain-containing protein [Halteromyces radiatus]|uniref:cortical protein marker for cell polarity-domain-containing protein n=1 Tax=Halteromyces radiatus TaxID=101107 RepID=UPI0022206D8E|nr:cortical protein marker for cell polarity-domain-containing protein [Halteromyces radiatus]KAI8085163.1 cortical protein marker for cell polarity-domain-containing protein [Halteromyces radiatus]